MGQTLSVYILEQNLIQFSGDMSFRDNGYLVIHNMCEDNTLTVCFATTVSPCHIIQLQKG